MINPVLDKIGQEIKPGSIIAYGHALGRCAGVRIGKVIRINHKPDKWNEKKIIITVTVHGIDDDWSHKEIELCARKGTLFFPERMIVVDYNNLPEKYQTLLNKIDVD